MDDEERQARTHVRTLPTQRQIILATMAEYVRLGSGPSSHGMDKSITLPPDEIFRNLENAKRFAIDIGTWSADVTPLFSSSEANLVRHWANITQQSDCRDARRKQHTGNVCRLKPSLSSLALRHVVRLETRPDPFNPLV